MDSLKYTQVKEMLIASDIDVQKASKEDILKVRNKIKSQIPVEIYIMILEAIAEIQQ